MLRVLGLTKDLRTNTPVVYAQIGISDYLELVGEDFDLFAIQRRKEKHKGYARMKRDIVAGALLPTITLATPPESVPNLVRLFENDDRAALAAALNELPRLNILDGLQRTYVLKELQSEGAQFNPNQTLHLEFWLESETKNLIYRIIVLNAGQKPMSMRHQIEVLFSTFKDLLERDIPALELFLERTGARRTRAKKYAFDRIVAAYQCFLTKSHEIEKENLVAQKLVEEDILSEDEESLNIQFESFKSSLNRYTRIDEEVVRIYDGSNQLLPTGLEWFGTENVMNAFFSAVSDFGITDSRIQRINTALDILERNLAVAQPGSDPLHLSMMQEVTQGFNTRRINVGFATRRLVSQVFKEYFREEGEKSFDVLWASEAS